MGYSGWTDPSIFDTKTVAVGFLPRQLHKIVFGLPLLESGLCILDKKEIRCMQSAHPPSKRAAVFNSQRSWLVIVCENIGIMLHLIYRREFALMTFELTGHPHLSARISTAH